MSAETIDTEESCNALVAEHPMNPHTRRHRQRRRDTRNRVTNLVCRSSQTRYGADYVPLPRFVTWAGFTEDVLIWGASRIPADRIRARRWPWSIDRTPLSDEAKSQLAAILHPHLVGPILKPRHPSWDEFYDRRLEP